MPPKKINQKADGLSGQLSILIRPKRKKYILNKKVSPSCVFCMAASKKPQVQSLCLLQTPMSMVILNKYPYNSGHCLVLPKKHIGNIFEFTPDEYTDLMLLLKLTAQAITDVYKPTGLNIGLNHGEVSGAGIPDHLHWHIIPRWKGDLNFFPLIAQSKVIIEDPKDSYKRLQSRILRLYNKGDLTS